MEIAFIAPFASRPSFIYCVCNFLTRSSDTFPIVSNSDLNNLPKSLEKLHLPKKYDKEIKNINQLCQIIKI